MDIYKKLLDQFGQKQLDCERRPPTSPIRSQCFASVICSSHINSSVLLYFYVVLLLSFIDAGALGYEEAVIITVATVSVLAVLAVAAFFGYRMMHGELPWLHAVIKNIHYSRLFHFFGMILCSLADGVRVGFFVCKCFCVFGNCLSTLWVAVCVFQVTVSKVSTI